MRPATHFYTSYIHASILKNSIDMKDEKQSHLVLYRKHRPKNWDEVIGQDHVIGVLRAAMKQGRVAHAYLFSGPRGVGKTTTARLLAKAVNCSDRASAPCNDCASCASYSDGSALNLIEIDAASNRGVDDIRELREGVRLAPAIGAHKIYIIDEVHQLSKDAFNALLKTLEEPPAHAIFVLATTELDKVPQTIISRTQAFDFRRPAVADMKKRLMKIAKAEGYELDDTAAHQVALLGEGSMRDAESVLGRVLAVSDGQIALVDIEETLGIPKSEIVHTLMEAVAAKDVGRAMGAVENAMDLGYDLGYLSRVLLRRFRAILFLKTDPQLERFIAGEMLPQDVALAKSLMGSFSHTDLEQNIKVLFEAERDAKRSPIPQLPLEMALVEMATREA